MDNTSFNISPVVGFKIDTSDSGNSPELLSVAATNKVVAIRTDFSLPVLAEWPYSDAKEILDNKKLPETPTAMDISPNSNYLVLGYESGTINIIDLEKQTIAKQIKRKEKPGIKSIRFSSDSLAFTVIDNNGALSIFTCNITLSFITVKERNYRSEERLTSAFINKYDDDWLIASSLDTLYHVSLSDDDELQLSVIYQPSNLSEISFTCDMYKDTLIVGATCGNEFNVYTVNKFGSYKFSSGTECECDVKQAVYLSNRVFVLVLADFSLQIIKASGKAGDHCVSDGLASAIKNAKVIFSAHQKLFLMNEAACLQLSFLDWGTFLQELAKEEKWEECFELAIGIYTGNNLEFFGIPSSVKKRCIQVKTTMQFIFDSILKRIDVSEEVFVKIMTTAGVLEMGQFLGKTLLDYAAKHYFIETYFITLFGVQDDLARFSTDECLDILFLQPAEAVSDLLINSSILSRYPEKIVEFALKHKLTKLLMKIWLDVYGDYLSPCIYLSESNELHTYFETVFFGDDANYVQKSIVCLWIFCVIENRFPRLYNLITNKEIKSPEIIEQCFKLCPIVMRDGTTLDAEMMADAILRSMNEYAKTIQREEINKKDPQIFKILAVTGHYILENNIVVPISSLRFLLYWIFNDTENIDVRENLLQLINCNYPDIVVLSDLLVECEAAGFTEIITQFYMADKSYDLVLQVLASIPQRRNKIFPFIKEHINETEPIRKAIQHNFQVLVLLDPIEAVKLVHDSWPEFHRIFMAMDSKPFAKYVYMKTINDNPDWAGCFTEEDTFEYFKLICQFCPDEALPMLKATHTIMFDEALPICMRNRVVDACVHIHTMLGDNESAVKMISEELQQELVEILHSRKKLRVSSIDRVRDEPNLVKPYNTIYLAFDLLDKTPELGVMLDEMWRDIFKAFQLPMYLIEKVLDTKTKQSFILFFAFFIVEVIPKTSGDFVMNTLNRDFKIMSQKLLKDVLQAVFVHFDYEKMLSGTVRSLLMEDCKTLRVDAALIKTRAANIWSTRCGICGQFITGQGGVGMLVYQCGHCFHNNRLCGNHTTCPVCKGIAAQRQNNEIQLSNRARSNRARALQRVEFGLRHNYGDDQDETLVGNYIYFLPDFPCANLSKFNFKPASELPEATPVFLEI